MTLLRFLGLTLLLGAAACDKNPPPPVPATNAMDPAEVLEGARARPVPPEVRVRFQIKVRSEKLDLAGSTGGGLVLARPGRGRLDVLGPLGSPLISVASDGQGLEALVPRKKRHLEAASADEVIREVTEGAAGLDDVLAVLQGDLPFDAATPREVTRQDDGSVLLSLDGPKDVDVLAVLEADTDTLRRIEAIDTAEDRLLMAVDYTAFVEEDGVYWPESLTLTVPALDLEATLSYKSWQPLEEVPDVFTLKVPDGIETEAIEDVLGELAEELPEGTIPDGVSPGEAPPAEGSGPADAPATEGDGAEAP